MKLNTDMMALRAALTGGYSETEDGKYSVTLERHYTPSGPVLDGYIVRQIDEHQSHRIAESSRRELLDRLPASVSSPFLAVVESASYAGSAISNPYIDYDRSREEAKDRLRAAIEQYAEEHNTPQ